MSYKQSNNIQQFFGKKHAAPSTFQSFHLTSGQATPTTQGWWICSMFPQPEAEGGEGMYGGSCYLPTSSNICTIEISWASMSFVSLWSQNAHNAHSFPTLNNPLCWFESCIYLDLQVGSFPLPGMARMPSHCIVPPRWRVSHGSEDDMWAWGARTRTWFGIKRFQAFHNYFGLYIIKWYIGYICHLFILMIFNNLICSKIRNIYNMGVSKHNGTPKWMVYNGTPN